MDEFIATGRQFVTRTVYITDLLRVFIRYNARHTPRAAQVFLLQQSQQPVDAAQRAITPDGQRFFASGHRRHLTENAVNIIEINSNHHRRAVTCGPVLFSHWHAPASTSVRRPGNVQTTRHPALSGEQKMRQVA
ncbi:hypothetical protein SRABI106_04590 [Rahnella aquatilis]|nr:hypothetical protein SRABI106_04590 [Rahnella aquatilis]